MLTGVLLSLAAMLAGVAADPCHCLISGQAYNCPLPVPCGAPNAAGFVSCCVGGDTCGADGFCHFTHSQAGTSGYYLASCTDPTYSDSSCPLTCTDNPTQDVVYNATSGLWACCYNNGGQVDCSNPGKETFQAPPPKELFSAPFSVLTAAATSSPSKAPSSSPSSRPLSSPSSSPPSSSPARSASPLTKSSNALTSEATSTQQSASSSTGNSGNSGLQTSGTVPTQSASIADVSSSSSSSGLSTGAKAGIGIGVTLAVIALLSIAFLVLRRRRASHKEPQTLPRQSDIKHNYNWHELETSQVHQQAPRANPFGPAGHVQRDMKDSGYYQRPLRSELSASVYQTPSELGS